MRSILSQLTRSGVANVVQSLGTWEGAVGATRVAGRTFRRGLDALDGRTRSFLARLDRWLRDTLSADERAITIIEPRTSRSAFDVREIWSRRELLRVLVERDIRLRYKQTVLGLAWAVLQPLLMMAVFSLFFGKLARMPSDGLPYPVFVYAGLLPWLFFSNSIATASQSLLTSAQLVSKVYFPRILIPAASCGAATLDFLIASVLLILMMLYYGLGFSLQLLLLPGIAAGILLLAASVGTIFSALTVAYRDFRFVVPFMLQFWMFATPVVFPASIVPEGYRWLLALNPMSGYIEGFRAALLGQPLDCGALLFSVLATAVVVVTGVKYFDRVQARFADII